MRCSREIELERLARGELDPAASAELVTHVASCATCRPALRELRAVRALLQATPEVTPSELEWRRIDKHVVESMHAAHVGRSSWSVGTAATALVALAAGLAVVVLTRPAPQAPPPVVASRQAAAAPAIALAEGGQVHTSHAPQVLEGDELRTTEGSLEVQTAPATGIGLAAHSIATATRLRVGETELSLTQGELLAEVKPLTAGQSFQIRAGDLVVHVVGTAFLVGRSANSVRVAVIHGRVRVDRPGHPGSFDVAGGTEATVADGQDLSSVQSTPIASNLAPRFPLGFPDLAPEAVAAQYRETSIDSSPEGARATVDGADRGQTPLTLLASEGSHELDLIYPGRTAKHTRMQVSAAAGSTQVQLAPEAVADEAPAPTPAPAPPAAKPSRKSHAATVAAAATEPEAAEERPLPTFLQAFATASATYQPDVQRCYADRGGMYPRELHLKVAVQPSGRVAPPIATDDVGVTPDFLDCVTQAALQWSFPVSGLSYDTTLPFRVQPHP